MEGFQRRYRELKALNAHVVGVSSDTWATQGAFAREIGAEFPLLSDWPSNRTIATFGVGAIRARRRCAPPSSSTPRACSRP